MKSRFRFHSLEVGDSGRLTYGAIVNGVTPDRLFEWYTDFSPEDVDIIKKRGDGYLLSRAVTRDGNRLHIESEIRGPGGRKLRQIADAEAHPEDYTYHIHTSMPGLEDDRHYTFIHVPEGSKISFEANYLPTSGLTKFLSATDLLGRMLAKGSKKTLDAYVAEAEEQLSPKRNS